MNKLFGSSKPKPQPEPAAASNINAPTLSETSGKVSFDVFFNFSYLTLKFNLILVGPTWKSYPSKD